MNICVFCSANDVAPQYVAAAEKLGRWLGREGHTLVYGGTNLGLMEAVARAAHEAGATVVGVVPAILEKTGRASDHIDVRVLCDSLDDRKAIMVERSDLFVALPGGVGTLDEIFTVVAAASIGYHHKRVVLLNIDGFWDSLLAMLDDLQSKGVLRPGLKETLTVVTEVEKVV